MPLDQQDVDTWKYDADGKPVPEQDKEMSFIDHLEELRWHVMRALIAICVAASSCSSSMTGTSVMYSTDRYMRTF